MPNISSPLWVAPAAAGFGPVLAAPRTGHDPDAPHDPAPSTPTVDGRPSIVPATALYDGACRQMVERIRKRGKLGGRS